MPGIDYRAVRAARNETLGTWIPRCTQAPLFPTSRLGLAPGPARLYSAWSGNWKTLSRGCPRVEPSKNSAALLGA